MRTVGAILKETRESKGISIAQVEQATKIRQKFLLAIENDEYTKLPSLAYAKGFVKNYSDFLGLNSKHIIAFYRRQTAEAPKSSLLPKGVSEPLNPSAVQLTPGRFLGMLLLGMVAMFVLYFGIQYRKLQLPPVLTIDSPSEALVSTDRRVDLLGHTDADATVTINGVSALVREDGKFFDQVDLTPGPNKITVTATSRFGKTTTIVRTVTLKEAQ